MVTPRQPAAILAAVLLAVVVSALLATGTRASDPTARAAGHKMATKADCEPIPSGVKCFPGQGKQTPGGGSSVSHKGWPKIYGIRWQVIDNGTKGYKRTGTDMNDELLGRGGSDTLDGGRGADVLWGSSNLQHNGPKQHDTLTGGSGADWIYASKGRNTIDAGSGDDHVFVYNGHGTLDCGKGDDTVRTGKGHYTLKHCEHKSKA
jgi:Ca2+-binding RTX toxin-like protein